MVYINQIKVPRNWNFSKKMPGLEVNHPCKSNGMWRADAPDVAASSCNASCPPQMNCPINQADGLMGQRGGLVFGVGCPWWKSQI